ncbi:MAG: transglycosylase domain-containing protein [Flavobacteriales bacterium]
MATTKTSKPNYNKRLWWIALSPVILVLVLLLAAMTSGLPSVDTLANPKINLATQVLGSDGKSFGAYYKENRADVRYDELPQVLVDALLATEDVRFREHSGVDIRALMRAIASAGSDGGASTITQQLAKMQFTITERRGGKLWRVWQKIREWIIACRIERLYTKDEIIALYLNQYDFSNQAVGIKSAAHIYFNATPKELKTEQCAMLVGMLKNSSLFNPMRASKVDTVTHRRSVVLNQMVKYSYLAEQTCDSLKKLPLGLDYQKMSHDEGPAPYFREVLRGKLQDILDEKDAQGGLKYHKADGSAYDIYSDGLKVYTTIDPVMQSYAEWAVEEHLRKELQPAFTKDVARRKKENFPFYNGIKKESREAIMNRAIKDSDRYKIATGNLCPECQRPAFYIARKTQDGVNLYYCDADKGGCGHQWHTRSEVDIEKEFGTAVKMKVYSHQGAKDTSLTPLDSIKYHKAILHASLMSIEPHSGHVKAWVGGIDFKHFKFDNVYQSKRQVGSTFKPIVYATALRIGGKNPTDVVDGSAITWGGWSPKNSGTGYGSYSMRCALANSVNTVSARLAQTYGIDNIISLAKRMGIKSYLDPVGPLSLGAANIPLYEMVGALSTFANNGVYVEPTFVLRIEDKNGTVIFEAEPKVEQALSPNDAYKMITMMKAVVDGSCGSGTGVRLRNAAKPYGGITYPTAGKTGTTQNNTDGWFMGLTPDLVTGVWVGAQDPTVRFTSTAIGQGANTGLPIYGYYMKKVYADADIKISKEDFAKPSGYDVGNTAVAGGPVGIDDLDDLDFEYEDTLSVGTKVVVETEEIIDSEGSEEEKDE